MNPVKFFTVTIGLAAFTQIGYSQTVANPGDVTKNAAVGQVNSTETSTINSGMNQAAGAIKGLFKKKKPAATTTNGTTTATGTTPATAGVATPGAATGTTGTGFVAYNNYDFVPGDTVVFADNFADDQDGEFPAHWNLGGGQGVVNTMSGVKVFAITDANFYRNALFSPLMKPVSYLNEAFTIEFDSYSAGGGMPHIYFFNNTTDGAKGGNHLGSKDLGTVRIGSAHGTEGSDEIEFKNHSESVDLTTAFPDDIKGANYLNKWHHIAIAYKRGQIKIYLDQYRVLVVPNVGFTPHAFDIEGVEATTQKPIMIANVRVANGGKMNMLGKKFTDAKLVTHGINFDIDQATIKPESMGTLNMIAGILKDNPDLKFEIDGHTDNSGAPAHNLTLSQQRADAVKAQLITMGIDGTRLTTKGMGDTKPLGDNVTNEGKANNRRVEFVRM